MHIGKGFALARFELIHHKGVYVGRGTTTLFARHQRNHLVSAGFITEIENYGSNNHIVLDCTYCDTRTTIYSEFFAKIGGFEELF